MKDKPINRDADPAPTGALLDGIEGPADLQRLRPEDLPALAAEIRERILDAVSRNGGHLASNLGVVELTIAMLRVFNPPTDKLIWDVSHQAYAFKLLTGRRDRFGSIRQTDGLSGFLKREESDCDAFGAGHSGTALSAALGMAVSRDLRGSGEHVIAIIGDAAVGNGISLEAFNNIIHATGRIIVILNDNEMSISANVGSLSRHLGKLLVNPRYNRWKRSVERSVASRLRMPWLRRLYFRAEETLKSFFLRNIMFEEFGLRYVGPIDGHDFQRLNDAMTIARESDQPILLHVSTTKGKGFRPAEERPEHWHSSAPFDRGTNLPLTTDTRPTYSAVFGKTLELLAEKDNRIVAITAAMAAGTGLTSFARRFPNRFFDVGISEEHAAVFAAGVAASGHIPVFAVYSTFAQRIVDCVIHDICLQNLPVVLCLDRAGLVGDDGPTHHGVFDIALFRPIPNLIIMQPRDEIELADMLCTAIASGKPCVIRYPRGRGTGATLPASPTPLTIGKASVIKTGETVQIWALGDMIPVAVQASALLESQGVSAGVVNARFVRPLDANLLSCHAQTARAVVTIENGVRSGGFGAGVEAFLREHEFAGTCLTFGWPDAFIPQGSPSVFMNRHGLTAEAIASAVLSRLNPAGAAAISTIKEPGEKK
jgi:1-deoxy-D-xylulose-5-phosphate synthase